MTFSFIFKKLSRALAAAVVVVFAACDNNEEWSPFVSNAVLQYDELGATQTTVKLFTYGDPAKTCAAAIKSGSEWCSFSDAKQQNTISGKAGSTFTLWLEVNADNEARTARIDVEFTDGTSKKFTLKQLGRSNNAEYEHSWGEQPEMVVKNDFIYKTYYTTLSDGRRVRNYSVCYDTEKLVSQWVAYPIHASYESPRSYAVKAGNTQGRTDAWAFDDAETEYTENSKGYQLLSTYLSVSGQDTYNTYTLPIIPQQKQQNIAQGAYSDSGVGGLNRGHMLPSASRYNSWTTNAQTFYATNMMPQNGSFNSGAWSKIETGARNSKCADTLFVVTGTIFDPGARILNSRERTITMPTRCYKMMLRTKRGNTGMKISDVTNADDLICIAFMFDNDASANNVSTAAAAVSVAEIEQITGFKFYRNLNPEIADAVKSQCDISDWSAFR